jgi:murein L,D-transpeptidase YcbB/YkuD
MRSQEMIEAMESAIQRYQAIVANGGWPSIPGARMIRPDDNDERVGILHQRLAISGDLKGKGAKQGLFGYDYSEDVEAAVRRFQESSGLRVTGRVDRATLQALNVPAHARLAQLKVNLQRLRDLMALKMDDRHIPGERGRLPAGGCRAASGRLAASRHRRQAGAADTDRARHGRGRQLLLPHWRVPRAWPPSTSSPRLAKEPGYLQQERIRVLTGSYNGPEIDPRQSTGQVDAAKIRFRQDPGPQNALGLVRIDMPNSEGVYMHDTPLKQLFNQRGRAFSAGCVRVQDVFTLVEWIAKYENGWGQPGRAQDVVAAGQSLDMTLTRPLPVYFTYITAWAEPNGRIVFRSDIYGRDGVRELLASGERDPDEGPAPPTALAP